MIDECAVARRCLCDHSYLLGLYVGDGYINHGSRTFRLHIYLHRDDHIVIARAARAIRMCDPDIPWAFAGRARRIFDGRDYPAYSFANVSEEIFTWACGVLGIRWRRANHDTISIARRADVARLDRLFEWKPQPLALPLRGTTPFRPPPGTPPRPARPAALR